MIVVKLLSVKVQPTFVLVDTETGNVEPGPVVQAADVKAADVAHLAELLESPRLQIEQQLGEP